MDLGGNLACPSCGERRGTDDRFCGLCGFSLAVDEPAGEPWSERPLEPMFLPSHDESPVRLLDPIAGVLGLAAVLLFGLSAWGVLRSSTIVVSGIGDGLVDVLAVDPTEPGPPVPGVDQAVSVFDTFEVRTVAAGEQLIVQRQTGISLLAASAQAWTLIDLDTGDRRRLAPQGTPVLFSDNHLVVERDRSLWSIPVAELGHDNAGVHVFSLGVDDHEEGSGFLAATLSGPDEMLVVSSRPEIRWQVARFDLTTGDRSWAAETPPSPFALSSGGLYEAVGGGTFDVIDGSWTKLTDGAPVVAGPSSVLVRVCGRPTECCYEWIDRSSGRVLDRAIPEAVIEADRRQRFLIPVDPDSQVMATFGPDGFTVVDMAKDRVLAFDDQFPGVLDVGLTRVEPGLTITARRGLVAEATGIGLELLDLEEDVRYRVGPDFFGPRPRRYLLVPT